MADKQKVVILGGGMASLAAAYQLSSTEELRGRFDVTVYQRGWRLGGKCASSRAPHPADPASLRIEEHGLHAWFGFYYNAFAMMRDCYGQLGDPAISFDTMFARRSSTPMMEQVGTGWRVWPLVFPEDPPAVGPGVTADPPTIADMTARMLNFLQAHLTHLMTALEEPAAPSGSLHRAAIANRSAAWLGETLASPAWQAPLQRQAPVAKPPAARLDAKRARVVTPRTTAFVAPELNTVLQQLTVQNAGGQWQQVRHDVQSLSLSLASIADTIRRAWILADLAAAVLRGLALASVSIANDGLGALDGLDFRAWLKQCSASDESIASAPIRAIYDLCFAYTDGDSSNAASANFAAGTALRCLMRISMGYKGAVCYTMTTGMGEAVIAPLYKVLQANGVQFAFFHKVDKLTVVNGTVTGIDFTCQATTASGDPYQPLLTTAQGLSYWRAEPDFDQLLHGDDLRAHPEVDFESDIAAPWSYETPLHLDLTQADGSIATVILGISVGALAGITADLAEPQSAWQTMLDRLGTVATQSAQIWMNVDLQGLDFSYPSPPPAMIAAPEPQDVWADMSAVVATENWTPALQPTSVQYLCGPLKQESFATLQAAQARVEANTAQWLPIMAAGAWLGAGAASGFNWDMIVATAPTQGPARLGEQYLRANFEGSERYVLSLAGSTEARLPVDAKPAANLFLAGDWTLNGLNAGCVEAAVMSGKLAANAVAGSELSPVPGSQD